MSETSKVATVPDPEDDRDHGPGLAKRRSERYDAETDTVSYETVHTWQCGNSICAACKAAWVDEERVRCPFTDDERRQCIHPEGHALADSPLTGPDAVDHTVLPKDMEVTGE